MPLKGDAATGRGAADPAEDFRTLAARVSRLIGAADRENLGVAVLDSLEQLGLFMSVDCAFATLVDDDERVRDEWNWCRPGCVVRPPAIGSPLRDTFGSIMEFLRLGWTIPIGDLDLVEMSASERALATVNDLRGILVSPVRLGDSLLGVIGLQTHGRPQEWDESAASHTELVAQIIVGTLARTHNRAAVALADARARRIARFMPDPLVMLDTAGIITWVSPSFSGVSGLGELAPIGVTLGQVSHPGDRSALASLAAAVPGQKHSVTARLAGPDGSWRWYELRWQMVADGTPGVPDEIVVSFRDIHDRYIRAEQLRLDNERDSLTGVLNRLGLDRWLTELERKEATIAVAFCDLDRFKDYNDLHGHAAGDLLLRSVADALVGVTRRSDQVARLGGDEFVVVVADPEDADCDDLAARLAASMDGLAEGVSLSVGVSDRGPASAGKRLLDQADGAMYEAKRGRRPES